MKKLIALLLVLATLAAACGSDGDDGTESSDAGSETTETTEPPESSEATDDSAMSDGSDAEASPAAIISLSPTATEILFAIGAGDAVIAVDDQSNYPAEAPASDLSGYQPNVESILAMGPDLVVISDSTVEAELNNAGVATIVQPAAITFDDVYTQIEQLGAATGHVGDAAELVGQMQADIATILADTPTTDSALTYFHEIDSTLYTATSATFLGEVYALFGLENIGDPADADGEAFGYPQLTEEFLFEANPDLIFLGDVLYGENADTVAARPGWDALAAVQNGGVVELDSDIASRWGPRVVDLVASISAAVNTAAVPA